jgi:GT2 family glycosyltransferase
VPVVGDSSLSRVQLHIVLAGANLGFAGGNNLGIELLLRFTDVERIWFINSDALPSKHAYREMTKAVCNEVEPFLAGSVLAEYWDPERIQTIGGRFWLYIGVSREMMAGKVIGDLSSLPTRVSVDYPAGAAMVVNRRFVTDCGRMREDYFLYYEEIDWVLRLGWPSKSFALPRSVVFHKGSSATGGSQDGAKRSLKSDYYMLRGRLLFARRVSRIAFWIALVMNICSILRRMCRSKSGLVTNAIRATRDGLRSEVKS